MSDRSQGDSRPSAFTPQKYSLSPENPVSSQEQSSEAHEESRTVVGPTAHESTLHPALSSTRISVSEPSSPQLFRRPLRPVGTTEDSNLSSKDQDIPLPKHARLVELQQRRRATSTEPVTERTHLPPRSQSVPRGEGRVARMSSAGSSPGNTSTSGSSSGTNPGYHLPYAPFPYPIPGNARGGQGGQNGQIGSSGSGK